MKYCLKWNNRCNHLKDCNEISIKYIEDRGLIDFMKKYADKRIILHLESVNFNDSEIAKLVAIKRQFPEYIFTVGLPKDNLQLTTKFQEKEIPFYILEPVKDWETLNYYTLTLGVSDIDISGPLGFELPKVKQFLEKNNLKTVVRATPNVIEFDLRGRNPFHKFFIRPDDIDLYEPYIDVIEFEGIEHQDTFYKIYANQKMFIGKLNQVIYNFPLPIDNMGLITQFGERRIDCGRECLSGGRCKRCMTLAHISETMGNYVREKVKENLTNQIKD